MKGGKVVYNGLEDGKMVYMNSDSKGDDVDLAEEFVSLYLDSDWEGEDGGYNIVRTTILRVTKKK